VQDWRDAVFAGRVDPRVRCHWWHACRFSRSCGSIHIVGDHTGNDVRWKTISTGGRSMAILHVRTRSRTARFDVRRPSAMPLRLTLAMVIAGGGGTHPPGPTWHSARRPNGLRLCCRALCRAERGTAHGHAPAACWAGPTSAAGPLAPSAESWPSRRLNSVSSCSKSAGATVSMYSSTFIQKSDTSRS
jgi:hypothetical protein